MGLLTAPFRGLLRVFEEVTDRAEKELFDPDTVKAELTEIYLGLEGGSLTEEEFGRREAELMKRLEAIEDHEKRGSGSGAR